MEFMDAQAARRDRYYRRNRYYHRDMLALLKYAVPEGSAVLEVGCATGNTLAALNPSRGTGIDLSARMVEQARANHPGLEFHQMDAEAITLEGVYDYIILSDSVGYFEDVQRVLAELRKVSGPDTRIIITFHNVLWQPFLNLLEGLKLKMPQLLLNWLNNNDLTNILKLEDYEVVRRGRRTLFPFRIPLLSGFLNRFVAHLPVFNALCISNYLIARPLPAGKEKVAPSVSVVVPARNERGNIREILDRVPLMGASTEVLFVEGGSTDGTFEEIEAAVRDYDGPLSLRYMRQDGTGKGNAVRRGFDAARGEVLMILDADLTVPPEDLPKFYEAIASGKGEFINGSRLVYPLEKQAMRTLNMLGNYFFASAFTWILSQPVRDTLCGTKVVSRANWDRISAGRKYFGEFDPFGDFDLLFGASKLHLAFLEVPIRYRARTYGDTNISRFRHGWLLLKMMFFALFKIRFV